MASTLGRAFGALLRGVRTAALPRSTARRDRTPSPKGAPTRDSTLTGARIEYNPDADGNADPGEVVWTWVPWEEDPTQGKDRPIVIVGVRGSMLIGVPLTSKRRPDEPQVAVGTGPWDREGRPSYAKLDRILEVDPAQVRREGSVLGRAHFDEIVAALRRH
jgi:hypothetical protein